MTATAVQFVTCIPSTEEEMHDIAREIASRYPTVTSFSNQIELLEQTVTYLKEYVERHRVNKRKS